MQPKYRSTGAPDRTGPFSFSRSIAQRTDIDESTEARQPRAWLLDIETPTLRSKQTQSHGLSLDARGAQCRSHRSRRTTCPPRPHESGDRRPRLRSEDPDRRIGFSPGPPVIASPPWDCRVSRTRADAIDNDAAPGPRSSIYSENITPSDRKPVVDALAILFATVRISRSNPDCRVNAA